MSLIEAIIIAIVEGITEYLPISSTGHMIITSYFMRIETDPFTKLFEVVIQLGAIMAVVVLYWRKFFDFSRLQFYFKLLIAVIPALFAGFFLEKYIDQLLESPMTVAISLILGGIILLFVDDFFKHPTKEDEKDISYVSAFLIGCWQVIAMIPGVSRSGASIIGGMQQKLTRSAAAEFSFFLAVPTMAAATIYKLGKEYKNIQAEHIKLLLVGNLVAFVVAMIAIKFLITFLQNHGFKLFGYYRIIAGLILLYLIWTGLIVE